MSNYITKSERIKLQVDEAIENFKRDRLRLYVELQRIEYQNDVTIEVELKPINGSTEALIKIGNIGDYEIITNIINKSSEV